MGFDNYLKEIEGKTANDPYYSSSSNMMSSSSKRSVWVPMPVIIGAGPAGMAAAACLKDKGIPSMILERSSCVGSLWKLKAYDRLKLHLPKKFCELPMMPFPKDFPKYPCKKMFIQYLEEYAEKFGIRPCFNRRVVAAEYDESLGVWRVRTAEEADEVEYLCRWLVVATGENADAVVPDIEGMGEFLGSLGTSSVVHTSEYKSGGAYYGKKVLVVGCGNSGMEVCLDLCNYNAKPSVVIRDSVHILPHEMLGTSTFGLSMFLLKWLPVRLVDWFLLAVTRLLVGDMGRFGLERPKLGPLELKSVSGKTPVLDVGTLERIKNGDVKIRPGIRRIRQHSVEFVDGRIENYDAIVLATGYKSNVPSWLKEKEMFSEKDGFPRRPFPNGWKGECGLYAAGFSRRGLLGASIDARNIANDIESCWRAESDHLQANTWTKY